MRLIDADALIENLKSNFDNGDVYTDKDQFIIDCIHLLDNAPTVEEKSYEMGYQDGCEDGLQGIRPQGEWEFVSRNCWKCSYCQELTNEGKNFCPNCGADMKGGAE